MGYQVSVPQFATIPLSGTVSSPAFVAKGAIDIALFIPSVTSCSVATQVAYTTAANSSDFLPLVVSPPSSGPFTLWVGVGSLSVGLSDVLGSWPTFRFVSSVPQSSARSLACVFKV